MLNYRTINLGKEGPPLSLAAITQLILKKACYLTKCTQQKNFLIVQCPCKKKEQRHCLKNIECINSVYQWTGSDVSYSFDIVVATQVEKTLKLCAKPEVCFRAANNFISKSREILISGDSIYIQIQVSQFYKWNICVNLD